MKLLTNRLVNHTAITRRNAMSLLLKVLQDVLIHRRNANKTRSGRKGQARCATLPLMIAERATATQVPQKELRGGVCGPLSAAGASSFRRRKPATGTGSRRRGRRAQWAQRSAPLSYTPSSGTFFNSMYRQQIIQAACPNIISRAGWGARSPKATTQLSKKPAPYVVVHHGESGACTTQSSCAAIVRSYQNYHMDSNGWSDIGYNFIIGEDGNVYEGRGWELTGAHAPGYNSQSIGICMIGSFGSRLPNTAALNALKNLIDCGVSKGKITSSYKEIGHRQAIDTDCPGNALYNWVKTQPHWTANP